MALLIVGYRVQSLTEPRRMLDGSRVPILMHAKSKTKNKYQPHIGAKEQAKWAKRHQPS